MIQINHNRYTGHEEQEECHPKTFDTFLTGKCLIEQPDQTQQKGQHIKDVTPCIILQIVGQIGLVSRNMLVDKIEATDPISVLHLSMSLYIVLSSGEVPHEITPIHVVQLIIEEESEILGKSGFHDRFSSFGSSHLYRTTFKISPLFICRYMFRFIAIHTREQHVQLGLILVMFVISGDYITVCLVLRCFQFFLPNGFALCRYGSPVGITSDFGRESLSIEQRPVAILFAVEITAQTKYIFGRILIHRGIGRRTNHNQRI